MSYKYFDGITKFVKVEEDIDKDLLSTASNLYKVVEDKMNNLRVNEALEEIFVLLRKSNKYIDDTTPWALAKDESKKDRLSTVLYNLLESIRIAAILLKAFIPSTSDEIIRQLNTKEVSYESIKTFGNLEVGNKLSNPVPLFTRIETK